MVELSRAGKRVYLANSLCGAWDDQFFPNGVGAWMVKLDVDPDNGGMMLDERFFPRGLRRGDGRLAALGCPSSACPSGRQLASRWAYRSR
jgi:hypothetical protein